MATKLSYPFEKGKTSQGGGEEEEEEEVDVKKWYLFRQVKNRTSEM